MNDIENRIKKAQSDSAELEQLLSDYLPLLKKQAGAAASPLLDYEDRLSLAMLTFVSCVRQYTENRGSFISFFSVCFHNRINDEIRRQNLYLKNVQTLTPAWFRCGRAGSRGRESLLRGLRQGTGTSLPLRRD